MPVLFYIVVCYTQYKEKEVVYMDYKERFVSIYKEKIHRDGSEKLLEYLLSAQSDFSAHRQVHVFMVLIHRVLWNIA